MLRGVLLLRREWLAPADLQNKFNQFVARMTVQGAQQA